MQVFMLNEYIYAGYIFMSVVRMWY